MPTCISCDVLSLKIKTQHFPRQKHYFPVGNLMTVNMSIFSTLASSPPSYSYLLRPRQTLSSHSVGNRSSLPKFALSKKTDKGEQYYLSWIIQRNLVIYPRASPSLWRTDPCTSLSASPSFPHAEGAFKNRPGC